MKLNELCDLKRDLFNTYLEPFIYYKENVKYETEYSVILTDPTNNNKYLGLNTLAILAERRAFEVQNSDYTDTSQFANAGMDLQVSKVNEFFEKFNNLRLFADKLKLVCEYKDRLTPTEFSVILTQVPTKIYNIINQIGTDRCKALSYKITDINRFIEDKSKKDLIINDLRPKLVKGKKYTSDEITA